MKLEADKAFEREIAELQRDKASVEKHLSELADEKLDLAISSGLRQGKESATTRRRRRIGLRTAIAVISMFLLLTAFVRVSPSFAALMKEIPGLSRFIELIEQDKSLLTAIDNEFIQPINRSDEKNDYKLSVSGIIADEKRLVILYTVEGEGLHDQSFHPKYRFVDEHGAEVSGVISYWQPEDFLSANDNVKHDYIDIVLDSEGKMPQLVQFEAQFGETLLTVDIPIDHERFEGLREYMELNQPFEVSGQRFTILDANITPLQITLTIKSDSDNPMRSNGFINLALLDEKGRRYIFKSGYGDFDEVFTAHFQSSYFERPKKLTLAADGLYRSERNLSLTVDTETIQTITAPDQRIQLADVQKKNGGYELKVDLQQLEELDMNRGYWLFDYNTSFKDAGGTEYSLLQRDGVATEWRPGSGIASYYYSIPDADYVQPLTFLISQYLGYVLEDIQVPIK